MEYLCAFAIANDAPSVAFVPFWVLFESAF